MAGMSGSSLIVETVRGTQVLPHLAAVAQLRIAVFRAWPYLYDGDADYERGYLAAYAASPDSVFVLARDGDTVIGASTGLPLLDDSDAFHAPFRAAGIDPASVFYFGESVLLPDYRGQGIGHAFLTSARRMRVHWAASRSLRSARWNAQKTIRASRPTIDPTTCSGANVAMHRKRTCACSWRGRSCNTVRSTTVCGYGRGHCRRDRVTSYAIDHSQPGQ